MQDQTTIDRREQLFLDALEQPEALRRAWLVSQCGDDAPLFEAVDQLLTSNARNTDGLLDALSVPTFTEQLPTRIGRYHVIRLIGSGAVGAVFEAQHSDTGREVAIKLIRTGFNSARQRLRFQVESELLAKLNHPGIAQLYDAGLTDVEYADGTVAGRPFMAMEFVDGVTITEFVRSNNLPVREQVQLIHQVAQAVAHAHQRGVIHRDLKPGNLLVQRATGQPKVVDFGIARLLQGSISQTTEGHAIGTPSFMSPEQLSGDLARIDLPTDVYGLGAVLYSLVAGRAPVEASGLLTPTLAVRLLAAEPDPIQKVARDVDRDLAAVIHKSLEREPLARYHNADDFAAELQRWLSGRPTLARPLGRLGRAGKAIRRRPKMAAATIAAGVILASFAAVAVWQAINARAALQKEIAAVAQQRAAVAYISDLLLRASPDSRFSLGPNYRLIDLIDQANKEIEVLADRPLVQADVRLTLGKIYLAMGRLDDAERNLQSAIAVKQSARQIGPDIIDAHETLARVLQDRNDWAAGRQLRQKVYDWCKIHLGEDHPKTLLALSELVIARLILNETSIDEKPEQIARRLEAIKAKRGDTWTIDDDLTLLRTRELAIRLMLDQGDDPLAGLPMLAKAEQQATQLLSAKHPVTLRLRRSHAIYLYRMGDSAAALPIAEDVRKGLAEKLGEEHLHVVTQDAFLAALAGDLGDFARALELAQSAEQRFTKLLGPQSLRSIQARELTALHLSALNRFEDAEQVLRTCLADYQKAGGPNEYFIRVSWMRLARLYIRQERYNDAIAIYDAQLPKITDDLPINPEIAEWYGGYAEALWNTGETERSRRFGRLLVASMRKSYGPEATNTQAAEALLDRLNQPPPR